ncbi:hypothetical protein [Alistipes putredinis]|uniref:hypothetical protein n=1 Tax=Alistipes putredinis TaxID=28117 RepID=UPI0024308510|nr:hypothetical protein [Alistipes putredinis]
METIEKRAKEFADAPCGWLCSNCMSDKMSCRFFNDKESFKAGAEWMHDELTRWNKLEGPPEIPTGRWRSKRVLLKKESGDYATGWAELINGQIRWTDGRVVFANLIGWREIHG